MAAQCNRWHANVSRDVKAASALEVRIWKHCSSCIEFTNTVLKPAPFQMGGAYARVISQAAARQKRFAWHSNVGEISAGKQRELSRGKCTWDHAPYGVAKQRVAPTLHRGVDIYATYLLQGQNGSERDGSARRGGACSTPCPCWADQWRK